MFKRPEEFIMAILAGLWVALTYFIVHYLGAVTQTSLMITGFTLLWSIAFSPCGNVISPVPSGRCLLVLLVACWWPYLDWMSIRNLLLPGAETDTIILAKPWYATWTFKLILSVIPTLLGYLLMFQQRKKNKLSA